MQVIYKIAEKQRKTRAGFLQLMDYISRDSFKTFGVGVSDDKDIASKQYLINKDLYDKNRDGKDRFTYHVMSSFGINVGIEKVIEIMLDFCEENFYNKGFDSFFAVHTDTDNIHCHVIADNVNFNTGNMIHSVTQKQFDSMSEKKKEKAKAETFVYEHQRKLFEDICIKHGLDISMEERYEYMHEQKVKEGRTWLTKEQYRAGKDKNSWRNILKDKLEEIYKNEDITEDNIKDIAINYGLEVTRHNKTNKTITFALLDEQGKKQRIKLERLSAQEKELNRDSTEENIFIYDNFFKRKEIEKEQEEVKEVNTYTVADSTKDKVFEKEKEYKNVLDNFYQDQETKKKEQESKAKALEKEIKDIQKAEIDKITQSDEVLRRLNIEEQERQSESKAKQEKEKEKTNSNEDDLMSSLEKLSNILNKKPEIDNKPKIFDRLKDFEELTNELEQLEFERDHRLTYSSKDFEKDFNNAISLAFYNLINRKVEFNNPKEADKANEIMENISKNTDDESIRRNLDLVNKLIKENEKEYERLKKNGFRGEVAEIEPVTELERTKINNDDNEIIRTDEEKEIEVAEIIESKQEITSSKSTITDSNPVITNNDSIITSSKEEIPNSKQEKKQEEKDDLESKEPKQVDLDSLMSKIDSYKLVEKYDLYDTLPPFQVINNDVLYNSETGEGDTYLARELIINKKGEEYWDNMNVKDIKQWEEVGVFTIYYTDSMDNFKEFAGYEDYSKDTIKHFLKENTEVAKELAKEYMQEQDSKSKTKDSKSYEDKEKDREIDF